MLVAVEDSNETKFKDNAAVTKSVAEQTAIKTGTFHCFLKQQPDCGSPNGGRSLPSSSLTGQPVLPCQEAGCLVAEGLGAYGLGVVQGAGSQ